ncbi:MAG: hypothetical protein KGL04_08250 [Elusimicrobia bacterium]|nr:hypothetical protein [Elusimicrobiota bacterium]
MEEHDPEQTPSPKRRTGAPIALAAAAVAAAVSLGVYYRYNQEMRKSSTTNLSGFDIAQSRMPAANQPSSPSPSAETPPQPASGGLSLVRGGFQPSPQNAASSPSEQADKELAAACRAHEGEVRALAIAYTKKYPIIAQYGRDWMSYPDLRKLGYDYMNNHDPVAFIRGVAASPNFRILVRKYAGQPAIRSFAMDVVTHAPADVLSAASAYLNNNQNMTSLANTILTALGLPAGLIGTSSSGAPRIDAGAMIQSVLNNPPSQQQQSGTPTLSQP